MPTINELAPATAAADTDEILVSQNGTTRKITRAQVLAGVQPALAIPAGTLLGRSSAGLGAPQTISVGNNLSLSGSTLVATAAPFVVSALPAGTVPAATDVVPLGQNGTNSSVSYSQFMSGLSAIPNLDASHAIVIPTGTTLSVKLGDLASTVLPVGGGSMTGPLILSGAPSVAGQAATKGYVDGQVATALPRAGGTLAGALSLAADPVTTLQAATKGYVDTKVSTAVPNTGGAVTGPITLPADPATGLQAATKQYVDTRVFRNGDTLTGPLVLAGAPAAPMQAATKGYVDTQLATALPLTGGAISGALTLAADPLAGLQAATKQYVDTRVLRNGDTLTGALVLAADPIAPLHAATKEYVDNQTALALPKAGGTLLGSLTLAGDPVSALQSATKQYVDNRVLRNGDTLTGALVLASNPTAPLQAATKQYVDAQGAAALPTTGGTMTGVLTLSADPTVGNQAATKHYVDAQLATALPINGGTLAGSLTLNGAPTLPGQAANKQYVDGQIATALPLTGGTLTGSLALAASPTVPMGAATKQYVDTVAGITGVINVKAAPYNAQLNGVTDDTTAFRAAYVAAPAESVIYVPFGVTVLQNPNNWGISLAKRVKWIVDGTTLIDGTPLAAGIGTSGSPVSIALPGIVVGNTQTGAEVSLASSAATDFAAQHSSYIVNHNGGTSSVISNHRTDTIIYNSPANFVWAGLDRLIWAGTQTPSGTSTAQHVGRYVQTIRAAVGTNSSGTPLPQPQLWAACLEMRDTTGQPSSVTNAMLTVEMDLVANGLDDANSRVIQSLVVEQNDTGGPAVEVANIISINLAAGSTGHAKNVFGVNIPFNNAVLNTTNAVQMSGAAAIRLAAGHAIAFEPTGSYNLSLSAQDGTLRWHQGALSYVVGRGLTVGWQYVVSGSTALPYNYAGDIVFLTGSGTYSVTLPLANTVPAGVGFTFSNTGSATVTIVPAGTDIIDNGPITLRPNDRYHIVSDFSGRWREIFRTNWVSPNFSGPPVLPSYAVSGLPSGMSAGAQAFAANGRKPSEAAGSGTGVNVFFDGSRWISCCSGTQVSA
jgi:hypothetical protein